MTPTFNTVDELFTALADERTGDVVTALAHALQCAWLLRQQRPHDEEMQVAGLVHDVASSLEPRPPGCHAAAGGELVRPLLGLRVAALVAGHVAAKRWLVSCDPTYRDRPSDNSRATLARQGDVFSASERAEFEASPYPAECILLRRADDDAKQPGRIVPSLASWRPLAQKLASRRLHPGEYETLILARRTMSDGYFVFSKMGQYPAQLSIEVPRRRDRGASSKHLSNSTRQQRTAV